MRQKFRHFGVRQQSRCWYKAERHRLVSCPTAACPVVLQSSHSLTGAVTRLYAIGVE
jgi:hypothetical protein